MAIAICIITYRRPKGLRRLLEGVDALQFTSSTPEIKVIVVDNDASGQACQTCEDVSLRWPLRCVVEPRQGIPQARNRAVREAKSIGTDFIAFIDDDEIPHQQWLAQLIIAQQEHNADIVGGPVYAIYPPGMENHPLASPSFYDYDGPPPGNPADHVATNNVLFRMETLQKVPGPFDERLQFTGGSDTLLTRLLEQEGAEITWAPRALVFEYVPKSRINASWLLKRAYRHGNCFTVIEQIIHPSILLRSIRLAKATRRILLGAFQLLVAIPRGQAACVSSLQLCSRGLGEIAALLGIHYEEYKKVHGT